ncbi:restriction endonuclease subunit S [bacterium endosymbiont of Bathymodiolus sp. 5 South]|uniref:restriction endonuclease subunit S n=1 Tax=bacterium endosymbiont of Bathymodiolus sp. 5 South TaxID=1181670 RepID=UPI0010B1E888|nr:restriction endonuclease subunit S [bacterium endosymbiont of Bathymodiolus sp. 5 South]SHN93999.1 Type I restriction-modification system, specificity subunit S [bacterium endosymbiont of Bathymodiolus sp. 5 South]
MSRLVPKLRFKEFSGEWEEKKLGDVFIGKKGQGLSKKDVVKNGKDKCILYGELYTRYSEVIKEVYSRTHSSAGVESKLGDLLIPCSTTTTAIDLANVTALEECDVLIGGDINILRFKKYGNSVFFSYYINFVKKLELSKYGQGGTIVHLYYNHFKEIELCFPSPKEQQKIANTLSTLDNLIEAQNQQINHLKQHKKGLMQQLFVSNEVGV